MVETGSGLSTWIPLLHVVPTIFLNRTRIEGAVKKCRANGATFVRRHGLQN